MGTPYEDAGSTCPEPTLAAKVTTKSPPVPAPSGIPSASSAPTPPQESIAALALNHTEESDQRVAFNCYWGLKEDRTLAEVSRILGIGIPVLEAWSAKYGWEAEVSSRQAVNALERTQEKSLYDMLKINNELISSLQERLEKHRAVMAEPDPKKRTAMKDYLLSANDYVRIAKVLLEVKGAIIGSIPKKLGDAILILDPVEAQKHIDAYEARVTKVTLSQ